MLPIKKMKLLLMKAASLSRLDYTASNKSVSNTKYAEFSIK